MDKLRLILLAEDNPNDAFLFRRAMARAHVSHPLHVVGDGSEAIQYLRGEGTFSDRRLFPFPFVLITDLHMPKCNGFELLTWLAKEMRFNSPPVVVLSSSDDQIDSRRAFELGARDYLVKPNDIHKLTSLVQGLKATWLPEFEPVKPDTSAKISANGTGEEEHARLLGETPRAQQSEPNRKPSGRRFPTTLRCQCQLSTSQNRWAAPS